MHCTPSTTAHDLVRIRRASCGPSVCKAHHRCYGSEKAYSTRAVFRRRQCHNITQRQNLFTPTRPYHATACSYLIPLLENQAVHTSYPGVAGMNALMGPCHGPWHCIDIITNATDTTDILWGTGMVVRWYLQTVLSEHYNGYNGCNRYTVGYGHDCPMVPSNGAQRTLQLIQRI